MKEVIIKITCCDQCQNFKRKQVYTADSFETLDDWICKKTRRKDSFITYMETFDKDPEIPEWCPLGVKKK